ncbi:MAG: preprotein translocase subunit SecA [Elusimicrobia bacterium]|nr:preprotein translocase subunit SecA [Elusimicrobiota bacterium]
MIQKLVYSIIGSPSSRRIKKLMPILEQINALAAEYETKPNEFFLAKTEELKAKVQAALAEIPAKPNDTDWQEAKWKAARKQAFEPVLVEAFAAVREAGRRTIGLRHFDVQLIGGMVLHEGGISEMKTGEGKTLVATSSVYLNALAGKGVHLVTVNDYLAKRDSQWMAPIYQFLGLTVGFVQHDMPNAERRASYLCDVTYVTNNEIGFDYLRDNMVVRAEDRVLRPLNYAIVDEVDSILVDEARTPLIISGPAEESTDRYAICNRIVPHLQIRMITEEEEIQSKYTGEDLGKGYDAIVDEKNHSAVLTEQGIQKSEKLLGVENLYDDLQGEWVHHITQALKGHFLYKRDVEYVVKDGEIIIVDEFTGRLMPGRRWSEGLHQAVEAKEQLPIKEENQTLATITFQNFFKLYNKVAGMTGTAMTEADEFFEIYQLDVVEIPPNRKNVRIDYSDLVYRTEREKYKAIVNEIEEMWKTRRPVLVGTRSIEKSEKLAAMLRGKGIPHQVLNAKHHEMESQIIAQAGKSGTVTIATNMAGRGTDIILGGSPPDLEDQKKVVELGGLHVLGTERHEARRIDNQLRGRCGRQGDPGSSRFYIALDDELMRLFGSERISMIMEKLGMQEDEVIESGLVSSQIAGAQRRVETHNFDIRKHLLDFDKVLNKQREVIYGLRNEILDGADVRNKVIPMFEEEIEEKLDLWAPAGKYQEEWDIPSLSAYLERTYGIQWAPTPEEVRRLDHERLQLELIDQVKELYAKRPEEFTGHDFVEVEKWVLLQMIDTAWKNHLYDLDHLKKAINLRAYAQKDPVVEYQKDSFGLFQTMLGRVREQTVEHLFKIQAPRRPAAPPPMTEIGPGEFGDGMTEQAPPPDAPKPSAHKSPLHTNGDETKGPKDLTKIKRNDPCFCGSGKKYKKCHGS